MLLFLIECSSTEFIDICAVTVPSEPTWVSWFCHRFCASCLSTVYMQMCFFCIRAVSIYWELSDISFLLNLQQEVMGYTVWFSCAKHTKCDLSSELWSDTGSMWDREHFIWPLILSDTVDCINQTLFCFLRKSLRKLFLQSRCTAEVYRWL